MGSSEISGLEGDDSPHEPPPERHGSAPDYNSLDAEEDAAHSEQPGGSAQGRSDAKDFLGDSHPEPGEEVVDEESEPISFLHGTGADAVLAELLKLEPAEAMRSPGPAELVKDAHEFAELVRHPPEGLGFEYRRRALRAARQTLDTADHILETWLRKTHQNAPSPGQLREAIDALRDPSWWDALLADPAGQGLGGGEQAQAAAEAIAQRIATMDVTDVHADDLERLRRDIRALRQQITVAEGQAEHLPAAIFRDYLDATRSIIWEVIVGVTAASATTAISGGEAWTAVLTAAVGAVVGASLGQLRSGVSRWHAKHTIRTQLGGAHRELRKTIGNLASYLPSLSSGDQQVQESVRNIALAAEGLANLASQLASEYGPPLANGPYGDLLGTARHLANLARNPKSHDSDTLSHIARELNSTNTKLSSYTDLIT